MTPEQVPAELVAKAKAVYMASWSPDEMAAALAAVIPEIQAQSLQDAANVLYGDERANGPLWHSLSVQTWLRDRAARLTTATTETTS